MRVLRLATVVLMAPLSPGGAQDSHPPAPGDIAFVLSCPASPCRFRQGDVIPVDLSFSTETPGYGVLNALNGYTGRFEFGWDLEKFTAEPAEGVIDPLGDAADYQVMGGSWNTGLDFLFGHGAAKRRLELNQWLYFEKPGKYRVTALSRRVCSTDGTHGWERKNCADVMSNSIEVEIVSAEPEWQRRQLERILQVLPPVQLRLTAPQKAAVRALTYLGTAEALEVIQNRLAAGSSSMDLTWRFARSFLLQMTAHEPVK